MIPANRSLLEPDWPAVDAESLPSERSKLRFNSRRSKLHLDIGRLRRCSRAEARAVDRSADLAACRAPTPAGTAWSGSAGPIDIADDRSRSGPAEESSGSLQRFLRLSTFAALPWKHCKQRLYGNATQWGRFGRLARLSPTRLAFAALARLRGL